MLSEGCPDLQVSQKGSSDANAWAWGDFCVASKTFFKFFIFKLREQEIIQHK